MIAKSWGAGFWSDISHVLGCLLLAEITGRIPVIHWGKNCLYGEGSQQDVFRNYFEPPSSATLDHILEIPGTTFFPPKWRRGNLADENVAEREWDGVRLGAAHFLTRPETVVVADFYIGVVYVAPWIPRDHPMYGKSLKEIYEYLNDKYLRVQPSIRAGCEKFFDRHLAGAPFIAVHMRGSDKIREEKDLPETIQIIQGAIAAVPASHRIFLLTDEEHRLVDMKELYGDRVVATECQRTKTSTGTHFLPSVDRVKAGVEIVTDAYLALRADQFIGSGGSNVSAMIAMMRRWPPGCCALVGESQLLQRHLSVYISKSKIQDLQGTISNGRQEIRTRLKSCWSALRRVARRSSSQKFIVNVYKDAGLWHHPPPGIGDYLRGCAFLVHASSEGPFAGQFRPGVNLDLSPGAGYLQRSRYHYAADRSALQGAQEFFFPPRDGNLLLAIEDFLRSSAPVLYISTNQSWRGLDIAPPRPVLDEVAQIVAFTPKFMDALRKSMPYLESEYVLIHVRDADRASSELDESEDELAFRARAMQFVRQIVDQYGSKTMVCISNNVRLRRILCETFGLMDPGTSMQNAGFVGTLSDAELADLALIKGAAQLFALSYFKWNSGFSVWMSRLFAVPARFENARSEI